MRAFQKALVLALITSFSIQADAYYKYVGSQGGGMTTAPSNGGTSQEDEGSRQ